MHAMPPTRPVRCETALAVRRILPNEMTAPRPSDRVVTLIERARHSA